MLVLRFSEFNDVVKFKNIENKWYPKLDIFFNSDLKIITFYNPPVSGKETARLRLCHNRVKTPYTPESFGSSTAGEKEKLINKLGLSKHEPLLLLKLKLTNFNMDLTAGISNPIQL